MRKTLSVTSCLALALSLGLAASAPTAGARAAATPPVQMSSLQRIKITKIRTGSHRTACGPACTSSRAHSVLILETRGLYPTEQLARSFVHWDPRTDTVYLLLATTWRRLPVSSSGGAGPRLRVEVPIFARNPGQHRGLPKLVVLGDGQARVLP